MKLKMISLAVGAALGLMVGFLIGTWLSAQGRLQGRQAEHDSSLSDPEPRTKTKPTKPEGTGI